MATTNVAIVGMGTVGSGVAKILLDQHARITQHAGKDLKLTRVVVADTKKQREVDLPDSILTDDLDEILNDPSISVVAQLVGGVETARTIMLKILHAGKDIVTANKALLAEHGPELFEVARSKNCSIAFEASVCGGIPIISAMSQSLTANQIISLRGILNGTSNYIVTKMDEEGADYASVVKEAQRLGYAEADPAFDVDGSDAAQKLAILAQLGFRAKVNWSDIPKRGIDSVNLKDFAYARQMGYRIKLIAFAELGGDGLQLSVAPMLVRLGKPLAEVRENYNAVSVVGDAVGPVFLHGQGAGQMPTASAVVADLVDTAVGRTEITFRTTELWSQNSPAVNLDQPGNLEGRFYLRFSVDDQPGVLAQIAGVLGEFGISIASVIQHDHEATDESGVPVVIMTQLAPESSARDAVAKIRNMPSVRDDFERLRIL